MDSNYNKSTISGAMSKSFGFNLTLTIQSEENWHGTNNPLFSDNKSLQYNFKSRC